MDNLLSQFNFSVLSKVKAEKKTKANKGFVNNFIENIEPQSNNPVF